MLFTKLANLQVALCIVSIEYELMIFMIKNFNRISIKVNPIAFVSQLLSVAFYLVKHIEQSVTRKSCYVYAPLWEQSLFRNFLHKIEAVICFVFVSSCIVNNGLLSHPGNCKPIA